MRKSIQRSSGDSRKELGEDRDCAQTILKSVLVRYFLFGFVFRIRTIAVMVFQFRVVAGTP
jgi:hypothetical protein